MNEPRPVSPWTEARDDELRRLWATGTRTGLIAEALRTTRNAIIGRVHRLHLPKRAVPEALRKPAEPREAKPPAPKPKPAKPPKPPPRSFPPSAPKAPSAAVRLDEPLRLDAAFASAAPPHQQPRGCAYITGSGSSWRYCQAPVEPERPYCPDHCARCYRRADQPEE